MGHISLDRPIVSGGIACVLDTIAMVFLGSHLASSLLTRLHMAGLDQVEKTNHFRVNISQTIVVVQRA